MAVSEKSKKNLKPAKKGEIRNPKGKPKGTLNPATVINKLLTSETKMENPLTGQTDKMSGMEAMALAQFKRAVKNGDTAAFTALLDRVVGRPITPVDMNVETGNSFMDFLKATSK